MFTIEVGLVRLFLRFVVEDPFVIVNTYEQ